MNGEVVVHKPCSIGASKIIQSLRIHHGKTYFPRGVSSKAQPIKINVLPILMGYAPPSFRQTVLSEDQILKAAGWVKWGQLHGC